MHSKLACDAMCVLNYKANSCLHFWINEKKTRRRHNNQYGHGHEGFSDNHTQFS